MATWRTLISREMEIHGETWDDVESAALAPNVQPWWDDDDERVASKKEAANFDADFDAGFGGAEGCFFTLWTKRRVYFPVVYDGAEWCESVPRNPCDQATKHVGGQ